MSKKEWTKKCNLNKKNKNLKNLEKKLKTLIYVVITFLANAFALIKSL